MRTGEATRTAVIPIFLLACLLLGGSAQSAWPNLVLQIASIAILAWAALAVPQAQSGMSGRNLVWLCYAVVGLVALQLVPLPPALWTTLPGREPVVNGFAMLKQPLPWLPLSLTPYGTITSSLWLLPPMAIMAGILRLGAYRETWLAIAMGSAALSAVLLGVLQVTSPDVLNSPWYLYSITNHGKATGFFANSNHMATLMIVTIPFMVALIGVKRSRKHAVQHLAWRIAVVGGAILILVVGLVLNSSTAGLGLAVPTLAASLLIRTPLSARWAKLGIGGVILLGIASLVAIFATPLQGGLSTSADSSFSTRATSNRNSLRAVADVFPVGSGSGSFNAIYPAYENPDIVDRWYVNHVHNDYIELALETGMAGIVLILLFLIWWIGRAIAIWRERIINHFARAATIASAIILAHSIVDFPLRTTAIAAVFAACVAVMAGPRRRLKVETPAEGAEGARHLSLS